MSYQSFGIFDFQNGIVDAREPWLMPRNAWDKLENGLVFRGRLSKRFGYVPYGELGTAVTGEVIDTAPYDNPLVTTLANTDVLPHEQPPSTYEVQLREQGGSNQIIYDNPINADRTAPNSGLLSQILQEVVAPGGTFLNLQLLGGTSVGFYEDSLDAAQKAELYPEYDPGFPTLDQGFGFYAVDPQRRLPTPAAVTISWTLPAPASIVIPLIDNYRPAVHSILSQGEVTVDLSHPDLDPGGVNRLSLTNTVAFFTNLQMNFLVDPGNVTVDYRSASGYIDYPTGGIQAEWAVTPTADVAAFYEYQAGDPVMGIRGFADNAGGEYLIACTTRGLWQFDLAQDRFVLQEPAAFSLAGDDDFVWFEGFEDYLVLTNGADPVKKWEPALTSLTDFGTVFNPDTGDSILNAKIVLRDRNRLVYFQTTENPGGTEYLQRGRWTPVNSVEYQGASVESQNDFIDAPTEFRLVTAVRVGDDIICGFTRGQWWRFRYDGNPQQPFRWEKLLSEEGAAARFGTVVLPEQAIARGETSFVGIDGVSVRPIDQAIPDYLRSWNQGARRYSYAHYSKELREILMTYVDGEDSLPESVFSIHVDETRTQLSFSEYKFPDSFHCFGEWRETQTAVWDAIDLPWDNIETAWDDTVGIEGFPIVLAGDRTGRIYRYGYVYTDDGEPVTMTARTKRLNPFMVPGQQNYRCHLGWIDFQFDSPSGEGTVTVRIYADFDSGAYYEQTSSISDFETGAGNKSYSRVLINRTATYHSIEIEVNSTERFNVDGIWLHCKPAGRMQAV